MLKYTLTQTKEISLHGKWFSMQTYFFTINNFKKKQKMITQAQFMKENKQKEVPHIEKQTAC